MSSDSNLTTASIETAALYRPAQPVPSVPHAQEPAARAVAKATAVGKDEAAAQPQRNEKTAGGEDLPPAAAREDAAPASVESAVSRITDFVQNFQRDLQFSIDKESDRLVVKVVDSETQEVIRQIPSEETLRIAQHLDSPESLILREQA